MKILRFAALGILAAALPLSAGQITKKYDLKTVKGIQALNLETDAIRVNQIEFSDEVSSPNLFSKGGMKATVRVDNNSPDDFEVGIAVVFFDEAGNIVAAGAGGTKVGFLKKGARDTHSIDFDYVFRNAKNAKTFTVTLETKAKEAAPKK